MRAAVVRTLMLALWRDRGALIMSFVLPVIVFLVFAAILSGATGDELRIRVVVANEGEGTLAGRLADAIARDGSLRVIGPARPDAAAVDRAVAEGTADAGIVVRRDGRALDDLVGEGPAPVLVITHPARAVAGTIASGAVQRAYFTAMPDAALRGVVALVDTAIVELSDDQRAEADAALARMATNLSQPGATSDAGAALTTLVETRMSAQSRGSLDQVTYYAGAVAALFVLLSAVHAASSLHDERTSGILDRVVTGPAGARALVDGRTLFLIGQGSVQTLVIFLVAWATYARQWPGALWAWLLMTIALATAAAGLTLLVATLARSTRQSQTAANVLILVASAVGGSMVPRYLMPAWLQAAGWLSPNAWVIEGYTRALGPDPQRVASVQPAIVLLAVGLIGWLVARRRVGGWETF
jgi:ABC-2 type transport system permease protein